MGRLLGACLWHGKPLGVTFATAFCRQVLAAAASVELVVKTVKEGGSSQDSDDDIGDDGTEDEDDEDEDAGIDDSSSELGQFPASLGGGCLGYGAAWRVTRKLPGPATTHPATAATVAAGRRNGNYASNLAPTPQGEPTAGEEATALGMNTSHTEELSDSSESSGTSRLATATSTVDDTLPSSSPWVLIGGAKEACPEGECVLPATMLQCLGVQDGDIVVVMAPSRARNRAGRLLLGPPGDKDLELAASGATVTAAFQNEVYCGWLDPSATAQTGMMAQFGSSAECRRGNCCADCKATSFPVRDHSTGRARCPVAYSTSSNSNSGSSSNDDSTVAASVSWAVVPRLKGQRPTKRRQVVPRNGMAEAHDLTFMLALTHDVDTGGNRNTVGLGGGEDDEGDSDKGDDEESGNIGAAAPKRGSTLRAEIARALGIDRKNHSSSSSRGATENEIAQGGIDKKSSLLRLLASTGAMNAPCVAKGARFGFRWCDADLELVVTEVRQSI